MTVRKIENAKDFLAILEQRISQTQQNTSTYKALTECYNEMVDRKVSFLSVNRVLAIWGITIPEEPERAWEVFRKLTGISFDMPKPKAKESATTIPAPLPTPKPSLSFASAMAEAFEQGIAAEVASLRDTLEAVAQATAETVTRAELAELLKSLPKAETNTLSFSINQAPPITLTGYVPPFMPLLLAACANRVNILLVGPAGTGKTSAAKNAAKALGIERVIAQSFCAQTPESRIFGYMDATGCYSSTPFRECYEKGGVYILDEMDAASPNILTALNAALDNGECTFPDKVIARHNDFIAIACANTFGNGADRSYVGRQQLDAATLNRFVKLFVPYDSQLDLAVAGMPFTCKPIELTPVEHPDTVRALWHTQCLAARTCVEANGIRAIISPRQIRDGLKLLLSGVPLDKVQEMTILDGLSPSDKAKVYDAMRYR